MVLPSGLLTVHWVFIIPSRLSWSQFSCSDRRSRLALPPWTCTLFRSRIAALYLASQVKVFYPCGFNLAEFRQLSQVSSRGQRLRVPSPEAFLQNRSWLCCKALREQAQKRARPTATDLHTDVPPTPPCPFACLGAARSHLSWRRFRPTDEWHPRGHGHAECMGSPTRASPACWESTR